MKNKEHTITRIEKYKEEIIEESVKQIALVCWITAGVVALVVNPKFDEMDVSNQIFMDTKLIISVLVILKCAENLVGSILRLIKLKSKKKKLIKIKENIAELNSYKLENEEKVKKLKLR